MRTDLSLVLKHDDRCNRYTSALTYIMFVEGFIGAITCRAEENFGRGFLYAPRKRARISGRLVILLKTRNKRLVVLTWRIASSADILANNRNAKKGRRGKSLFIEMR